jgi:ACS family tartrate transporter-like MFS transporter
MDIERATIHRVSRRLLPFIFLLYVVCYLDRINVSFAALQMNRELGFSASVYGFGAGIFFLGYVLFQVPANLIMARLGARRWIGGIMLTWGLVSGGMALMRTPAEFYALRIMLGFAEAGFFPGMILFLTKWFPGRYRARAVSRFMTAIPISAIIGGPVSGSLLGLGGLAGLSGWRWLFILEALPALVLGLVTLSWLTDRPSDARWLSSEERAWLIAEMERDQSAGADPAGRSVQQLLARGPVWALGLLWMMLIVAGYGLSLWLPQILQDRSGASDFVVGLLSAIPQVVAVLGMVYIGARSDQTGERFLHVAAPAALGALGLVGSAYFHSLPLLIVALSLATMGVTGIFGPFWSLPQLFLGTAAAAGAIALINSIGNVGGFLGPYLIGFIKDATHSYQGGLLVLAGLQSVGVLIVLGLRRLRE